MLKLTEFYNERQGRPASNIALDMDTRGPSIPSGYISGVLLSASYTVTEQSNNFTAGDATVILVDTGGSGVTITLPATSVRNGKYYIIKKIDSSGGIVTIKGDSSGETIDDELDLKLTLQYSYVWVLSDGTDWHIIGGVFVKLETLINKLMQEQIGLLDKIYTTISKNNVHLSSMSDAEVESDDGRDD